MTKTEYQVEAATAPASRQPLPVPAVHAAVGRARGVRGVISRGLVYVTRAAQFASSKLAARFGPDWALIVFGTDAVPAPREDAGARIRSARSTASQRPSCLTGMTTPYFV